MTDPVRFTIAPHGRTWTVTRSEADRPDQTLGEYSHLEQATHDAARLARELQETGEPARVFVQAAEGKVIEVDVGPEVTREVERNGPDPD